MKDPESQGDGSVASASSVITGQLRMGGSSKLVRGLLVFVGVALLVCACRGQAEQRGEVSVSVAAAPSQETAAAAAVPLVRLPPEPPPPEASSAGEVPTFEAKLAADPVYKSLWEPAQRDRLRLVLSGLSQLICSSAIDDERLKKLESLNAQHAVIQLFLIHVRVNAFPADFMLRFREFLSQIKDEPNLGVWGVGAPGKSGHDFAALAAWAHQADPAYLRQLLAARRDGDDKWMEQGEPALRPYLVDERAALERLALLTPLAVDEEGRLAELLKPREPRLGEPFRLGAYTYTVKDVTTYSALGTGFGLKKASEGASFLVVAYALRNEGRETTTVLADDFRIIDAEGRSFRPSAEGNTALTMAGNKDLIVAELHPGVTRQMQTAFELPEAAAKGVVVLEIPEKGAGAAGKKVRITLK
jgi:hypothetical protein